MSTEQRRQATFLDLPVELLRDVAVFLHVHAVHKLRFLSRYTYQVLRFDNDLAFAVKNLRAVTSIWQHPGVDETTEPIRRRQLGWICDELILEIVKRMASPAKSVDAIYWPAAIIACDDPIKILPILAPLEDVRNARRGIHLLAAVFCAKRGDDWEKIEEADSGNFTTEVMEFFKNHLREAVDSDPESILLLLGHPDASAVAVLHDFSFLVADGDVARSTFVSWARGFIGLINPVNTVMRAIEVAGDDGIDVAKKDKAGALAFTLLDLCHTHANKLLSVAIEHDNTRMVDELLERRFYNTDFYAAGDKEDPLSLAVAKNNMHACSRLLTIAGFMKCDLLPTFVLAPSTSPLRLLLKSSWIHSHVAAAMEIAINGGAAEAVELLRSYDAANGLNSELDCSWYITKTRAARNWSAIELLVRDTERPVLPDGDLTEIFDRCVIALNRPMAWVILRHMHHRLQLKEVLTVENLMFLLRAKPFEMLEPHVKALTDTGLCKIADVEAAVKLLWDGATALKELHFTLVITGSISQTFIDESFVEAARTRNWKLGQILIETERVGVELLKKWTPFIVGFRALTVLAQAGAVHTLPALVAVLGCSSRNDNRGLLRAMKIFQRCKSSLFEFAYRREDFPDIGLPVMHTAGRLYGELVRNDSTSLPTFRRVYRVLLDLGWGLDVDHGLILFCENEDQELVDLVLESIPSLVNTVVRWAIRKGKLEVAAKTLLQKHINTKKGVLFKSDDD